MEESSKGSKIISIFTILTSIVFMGFISCQHVTYPSAKYEEGQCLWYSLPIDVPSFLIITKVEESKYHIIHWAKDSRGWCSAPWFIKIEFLNSFPELAVIRCPYKYYKLGKVYFKGLPDHEQDEN